MRSFFLGTTIAIVACGTALTALAQTPNFTPPSLPTFQAPTIQPPAPPQKFQLPLPGKPGQPQAAPPQAAPAPPPVAKAAPPHTPSPLAQAEGGLCLALRQPQSGKGENDPALVCDCARAYGANLIKDAEAVIAALDKRADDLVAVGANVLGAEGVRELRTRVAKDHETLEGLKALWAHPDDQCHSWDARVPGKTPPQQETYLAQTAKSFSYNAVQSSVRSFWSFVLEDTGVQLSRLFVDNEIAHRAELKQFEDHRELCGAWTTAANARVQTITSGMLDAAAEIRRTYSRFKPELMQWNDFAGRDGWPSTLYPHTGLPPSFLEFSEPTPMDLAYHPDGYVGDKDYAVKLHYNIFTMDTAGPDRFYCGQWSPGAPAGVDMRVSTNKNDNNPVAFRLDPLKPVGRIEFYASGADATQRP